MNEIVNKFLLAGDKFMSKMRSNIMYHACWSFSKTKQNKIKERGDSWYLSK